MKKQAKILTYSIFLVFLITALTGVSAQTMPQKKGLQVNPAIYDITLIPKEKEKQITFNYTNISDQSVVLILSVYNYNLKDHSEGEVIFDKDASNKARSLIPYISLEPLQLSLAPKKSGVVTATIRNAEELSPGGHYAAVVAEINQDGASKNIPIVAPSVSSMLLVKKEGGEKYGLGFNGIQEQFLPFVFTYPQLFHLSFTNSGNVHLIVYGSVEQRDMFGRLLYKGVVNTSSLTIFPQKSRSLPVQMTKVSFSFPISINKLVVNGTDSLKKVSYHYEKTFVYVNIWALLVLVVVIFLIINMLKKVRRKT